MIKKIKKIFRIIVPKKLTSLEQFEYKLKCNNLIQSFEELDNIYLVNLLNNTKLYIRDYNYSDYDVFNQIFRFKEYEIILKMFLNNNFKNKQVNIIDAGANVGYTSSYFLSNLENAKVIAIEPSAENCEMILKNTANFKNIKLYQNALSEKENSFYNLDRDFRDGKDWSIATEESANGNVKGITINQIISENNLDYISLLKIDIEGAERFVFKKENDLKFLTITEIIALEIHDEFNIRKSINEILIEKNFFLFESGELTVGINRNIFNGKSA